MESTKPLNTEIRDIQGKQEYFKGQQEEIESLKDFYVLVRYHRFITEHEPEFTKIEVRNCSKILNLIKQSRPGEIKDTI